jgi:hypothetical protein
MRDRANPTRHLKSAERLAFEHYLRTGQRIEPNAVERKFNPYHDPRNGRFTFAPGGPRSIANAVFVDHRGLWRPRNETPPPKTSAKPVEPPQARLSTAAEHGPSAPAGEPQPTFQLAQYRPNPRARIGGNNGPALNDPLILEQAFPGLRESPAGAIVSLADNILDLTGPARALTADIHKAEVRKLVAQIQAIDPKYHYESLGAPKTIEGMANEIKALRFERAVKFYQIRGEARPLQIEVLRLMQERADSAYEEAEAKYKAGRLKPRLSREEAIGNYIDLAVRRELRERLNASGVDYSQGQPVRVIGREYDTSGSDLTYRVPDARVVRIAFDVTLTEKTLATPQVRGFFSGDFKPDFVIIIRPSQLGRRCTYIITRPRT